MKIKCQLVATEVFYCRSYCLLNMFRTSLCPSSGAQEYYTMVAACGISCCKNVKNNFVPLYNTLELLMMGIVMPETCWASNKICNKKPLLHLVGILFPHNNNIIVNKLVVFWLPYTVPLCYIDNGDVSTQERKYLIV